MSRIRLHHALMLVAVLCLTAIAAVPAFGAGVTPHDVTLNLNPGQSATVLKSVVTTKLPPKSDFVFLADNTGSMGPYINDVKANSQAIINAIEAAGATDAKYGVGNYQDFQQFGPCPYGFHLDTNLTTATAAKAAINTWAAGDGCDQAEANLFGLHRVAVHDISWRPGSAKFVIWFGDNPSHDPICSALPGYSDTHPTITEASVTADLVSQGIHVIAASIVNGPFSPGLDADPTPLSSGYDNVCGPPDGAAGQALRITAATGGVDLVNPPAGSISTTIINAINALPPIPVLVTPVATCDAGLTVTNLPPAQTVPSGSTASFTETITVSPAVPLGSVLHCTVDYTINGASAGPEFQERITVNVGVGVPFSITLTPPTATNTVGQQHCVTATVTDAFGNPVPGATVTFTVSGPNGPLAGAGVTNGSGQAQFCYTGFKPGTDTIVATVGTLTARATKTYTVGAPAKLVLTPKTATNVVGSQHCVTATVTDQFGNPVPGVTVDFSVTGSVTTSGTSVTGADGTAKFCYTGPSLPGADVITATAEGGSKPSDTATKTWILPTSTEGCKVTYGGRITAANGDKATFGGNAKGSGPSGQEEYQDHGPAIDMNVHSIAVLAVVCSADGTQASIFGTATVNGSGSYNFRIDLQDLGEPGVNDTYRIRLSNGYDSGEQTLNGGNVQIH